MSLNVLIVEDCDLVRRVMVKTLGLARIPMSELHEASNGREALDIISSNWIDLVLADLNMPVMDGVEMIDRLHADGMMKSIPVIVVSTEGSETRVEELRRKGISAYVRKPFTPEEIRDVVVGIVGEIDRCDRRGDLESTFCRVVERFALMVAEPHVDDADPADVPPEGWIEAKVAFRGPMTGTLTAAAAKPLLREIAANVLGMDSDDPETAAFVPEALKELVNLTAGQLLTEVADVVAVHDLSAPVLRAADPSGWDAGPGRTLAWFRVEGHPVALMLEMRRAAA